MKRLLAFLFALGCAAPALAVGSWGGITQIGPGQSAQFCWTSADAGDAQPALGFGAGELSFTTVVSSGSPSVAFYILEANSATPATSGTLAYTATANSRSPTAVSVNTGYVLDPDVDTAASGGCVTVSSAGYANRGINVSRGLPVTSALGGLPPTGCTFLGKEILDTDTGMLWVCTDVATDAFRNISARTQFYFLGQNVARATHFDGTFCIGQPAILNTNPTGCANQGSNLDQEYYANNFYVIQCFARAYGVTGTWEAGDTVTLDLRFQTSSTTTDSATTWTLTSGVVSGWQTKAFNTADPFADTSISAETVGFRPNFNSITDGNSSITDFDINMWCDGTTWD